jgi:nucleoside-diphosphate-sugar epimerase
MQKREMLIPEHGGSPRSLAKKRAPNGSFIISPDDRILITGAAGFIGSRVVENLLDRGFRNLVCFARPSGDLAQIEAIITRCPSGSRIEVFKGNLLSRQDCESASKDVAVVLHLAAGTSAKSFPDAFMNSVVATRNLLDACLLRGRLKRFVSVSSFTVYTNKGKSRWRLLDESCSVEENPCVREAAYCFAKSKQEQIITEYAKKFGIPYVFIRPGAVYGGDANITGRVGLNTFGIFLHLGGSNQIPFTYVDNCAEAIVLGGLVKGIDGEIFNVVDDNLPSSRQFLRQYKRHVKRFKSIYVPHAVSYMLCLLWDKYSRWSGGQLPPAFNLSRWHAEWKKTRYSNAKLKAKLGWTPRVSTAEGMRLYFDSCKKGEHHA